MKKLKIKFWLPGYDLVSNVVESVGFNRYWSKYSLDLSPYTRLLFNGESERERDEYLAEVVQAITDELFSGTGELKVGEMCEVKGRYYFTWHKSILLAILPEHIRERYVVDDNRDYGECIACAEARPIAKRTEPKVEVNGEIITYTWEE